MKNLRVVSAVIALLAMASSRPLAQWNWETPIPQGNNLLAVQFIDSTFGWAVGEYGTVLHTTTGGESWYEQEYGRTDNVLDVSMVSDTEGWAVGDNGIVLHTTDSGDDWVEQSSGVATGLNAVVFLDAQNGWAAGDNDVVLHTTNGGVSWTIQHQSVTPTSINGITFLSSTEGWCVGSNRHTFHTTDAGTTWVPSSIGVGSAAFLSVTFADPSDGFIVGTNSSIVETTDGGQTWFSVATGDTVNYNTVVMENSFVGWIVGDNGRFLRTVNGGASWSTSIVASGNNLTGLARADGKLWAVGEIGRILLSTNLGVSWTSLDSGPRLSANWVDFPSANVGAAVGQTGLLMRTTNGGSTWVESTSPVPSASCYGVKFIDDTHGWAVGDNGTILHTTDGSSWVEQSSGTSTSLFGVDFSGTANGWIVGGDYSSITGVIVKSTDGGGTWAVQNNSLPDVLFGVSFPTPTTGWVVGSGGSIFKTTDGGATWNSQASGVSSALYWCSFSDVNNGWAVGDLGKILVTSNGGGIWRTVSPGVNVALYSIVGVGGSDLYACGDLGTVVHSSDAGAHWDLQYTRTLNSLFGIALPPGGTGVIASGDYGSVLTYTPPVQPGTVTGIVFNDLNGNGILDAGEPGMSGWKVRLTGALTDSAVTGSGGTFTFSNLPLGSFTLSEIQQSSWTQTLPVSPSVYSFTLSSGAPSFTGNFGNHAASAYSYDVQAGWDLLSLPLIVTDPQVSTLYATAETKAFIYTSGYVESDTVPRGLGYWMKFPSSQTVWVAGTSILSDSITVHQGWNLIGSVNDTVPTSTIVSNPSGIVTSSYFGYQNSYIAATNLIPGNGYWVKTTQPGQLILPQGHGASSLAAARDADNTLASYSSLTVTDRQGRTATLAFGPAVGSAASDTRYELPPLPPAGAFDARFGSGSTLALFPPAPASGEKIALNIQTSAYPVSLTWEVRNGTESYQLIDSRSWKSIEELSGTGSIVLDEAATGALALAAYPASPSTGLPAEYALLQNTPNPFNPTTDIRYEVRDASHVAISVYDLMGRLVQSLVDESKSPGRYVATWNAGGVSSGIYYARMVVTLGSGAPIYQAARKMMVLK